MSTRTIFLAGYILIAFAFLACQLIASGPSARVAKIGDVVGAAKRRRLGWVMLVLTWWWLGFHVLARSSAMEP
jgi:hypothetical protein